MIAPLRFFEIYNACVLHFKDGSSYDFFKYAGKTTVTEATLLKRKDKYHFEKWSRKVANEEEAIALLASNAVKGKTYVIGLDWKNYQEWMAYRDSMVYKFASDLDLYSGTNKKSDPVEDCFSGDTKPYHYMVLMNHITNGNYFKICGKKYQNNILWEDLENKLLTYSPFVIYYWGVTHDIAGQLQNVLREKLQNENTK